jgi:hypothetical protein
MNLKYQTFETPEELCAFVQTGVSQVVQICSWADGTGRWLLFYVP